MSLRLETRAEAQRPAVGRAEFEGVHGPTAAGGKLEGNTGAGAPAGPSGGERRLARRRTTEAGC
jgi:hypothetical protein